MSAPGVGLSSGGRFHHQGQSVLYLAENDNLAMQETLDKPDEPALVWIQKYNQDNKIDGILDLRYEWSIQECSHFRCKMKVLRTCLRKQHVLLYDWNVIDA